MVTLKLDKTALADIGGQPRRLAFEIHRQVRDSLGAMPIPTPLAEIATALGIGEVIERSTSSFEGALVAAPDKSRGTIVLRKGMLRGRRNFTFGHEIGHFANPYHRPPSEGFVCDKRGMTAQRKSATPWESRSPYERMEVEANEFSVSLLIPVPEFRAALKDVSGCDLRHIEPLSRRFGTSKEVMARTYVNTADERIGVLISRHGELRTLILPPSFPYLGLAKGRQLPPRSLTAKFVNARAPGTVSELSNVSPDVWLDQSDGQVEVFEQALVQSDGWAMTMLLVDEPSEDQKDEDDEVERRWAEPRFAYGR